MPYPSQRIEERSCPRDSPLVMLTWLRCVFQVFPLPSLSVSSPHWAVGKDTSKQHLPLGGASTPPPSKMWYLPKLDSIPHRLVSLPGLKLIHSFASG